MPPDDGLLLRETEGEVQQHGGHQRLDDEVQSLEPRRGEEIEREHLHQAGHGAQRHAGPGTGVARPKRKITTAVTRSATPSSR